MKSETGKLIKFMLLTPGYKHASQSIDKHLLTQAQEDRISRLWQQFRDAVWAIISEEQ